MAKRPSPSQGKARKSSAKKKPAGKPRKLKLVDKPRKAAKAKTSVPKQPELPGTEGVRIPELDVIAHAIATARENKNLWVADEKEQVGEALRVMTDHGETFYRSHGVELFRVTGDQKLRVRLVADESTSGETTDQGDLAEGDV